MSDVNEYYIYRADTILLCSKTMHYLNITGDVHNV